MEKNDIQKFVDEFFRTLGCTLVYKENILEVTNIPSQFENFVGKRGPFLLSFDRPEKGAEVLKRGGYFLTAMANYLKTKSKITLIKLDINFDPEKEILARFTFPNSEIKGLSQSHQFETVTRFLFTTSFQYMNEKEHETIPIFIKDGKIFDLDLIKLYPSIEGNKKEITLSDFSEDYDLAKKVIKEKTMGKIQRLSRDLANSLSAESQRITAHYNQRMLEIDAEHGNLISQISHIKEELEKKPEEKKLIVRLQKSQETLANLKADERKKDLQQESELALHEEKNKYKLNVNHSLINTSVIYYPVYKFVLTLVNERARCNVVIDFDPVQKHMPPFVCPGTKNKIYKIYLDDAGMACSKESLTECFESGNFYCSSSMKLICAHSGRGIHPSNAGICSVTKKTYGKSYLKKDSLTGRLIYHNLLKFCPSCHGQTLEKTFTSCPSCGTKVCPRCLKKAFVEGEVKTKCGVCK
jgi:hypothetical protein